MFYHSFNILQIYECEDKIENFPFLSINDFIMDCGTNFAVENDKYHNNSTDKDFLKTVINRVKQFSENNDNTFKEQFLDNLKIYAEKIGFENTVDIVIPVLSKIPNDCYSIKIKFLNVFSNFFEFFKKNGDKAYLIIRDDLLKLIIEFFSDKKESDLIELASRHFIDIAMNLNTEDKGKFILSTLLNFANEDNEYRIESRCLAANLFSDLSEILGKEYCEQFITPQLIFLSDDSHFNVRKSVANCIVNISKQVSYNTFTNKLFPTYKILCSDTLWNVRKVCVDIISQILVIDEEKSNNSSNNDEFIEIFNNFILDSNKFVRAAVLEIFGQFVYQIDRAKLDERLFYFYKNSTEEYFFNIKKFGIESESTYNNSIIYNIAYNFPAVLYSFGESYWPKLKELYSNLANHPNQNVKFSIISSFHEIAKILGAPLFESYLLMIYDSFLSNKNEEIQNHAIKNLYKIVSLMNEENKKKYMNYLQVYDLSNYKKNWNKFDWRKRIEILKGYSENFKIFDIDFLFGKLIPLCIQFSFDDVFFVRQKSGKLLSKIFKLIIDEYDEEYKSKIYKILKSYASSQYFKSRLVFISICKHLLLNENLFHMILKDLLHKLAFDNITDTRISLAKLLSKIVDKKYCYAINEGIMKICLILSKDKKLSVRQFFSKIKINNCDFDANNKFENVVYDDTMEFLIKEFHINISFQLNHKKSIAGLYSDDLNSNPNLNLKIENGNKFINNKSINSVADNLDQTSFSNENDHLI